MPSTEPHRTPEELACLGVEAFNRHVCPTPRREDDGKFVAIDVDTGEHELDEGRRTSGCTRRPSHKVPRESEALQAGSLVSQVVRPFDW